MVRSAISTVALIATVLMILGFGRPQVLAQEATPAASEECATTTPEENKEVITQFVAAIDSGSADVSALLADEFTYHDPSGEDVTESAREGAAAWAANRSEDYPDLTMIIDRMIAEGDTVAAYMMSSGTHQDDDEEMGIPATGKQAEWVAAGFFRIECGKIADIWIVSDRLGRLQDLGVITAEELQSVESAATPAP